RFRAPSVCGMGRLPWAPSGAGRLGRWVGGIDEAVAAGAGFDVDLAGPQQVGKLRRKAHVATAAGPALGRYQRHAALLADGFVPREEGGVDDPHGLGALTLQ